MLHTPLNSSMIASAGWQDGILEIEFARGSKRYQYYADELLFNELVADASPGSFFHSRIKGKLQQVTSTTQLGAPPVESPVNRFEGYSKSSSDLAIPPQTPYSGLPLYPQDDYPSMANEEEIDI